MKYKYYALETNGKEADIYIFGDITSWEWYENDVSSYTLSKELQSLDADVINVHINSYGGEVAEGLAIYNLLRGHKAKVRTYCDGFACSIASVIFMAGDERIMNNASLLMVHNAWMYTAGNAEQLRKSAEDLDKITQASIQAYKSVATISEDKIKELLDNETWILPSEALEMGFATSIVGETASEKAAASARKALFNLVRKTNQAASESLEVKVDDGVLQQLLEQLKASATPSPTLEPDPEPEPEPESEPTPQENKLQIFFSAILGRKEG